MQLNFFYIAFSIGCGYFRVLCSISRFRSRRYIFYRFSPRAFYLSSIRFPSFAFPPANFPLCVIALAISRRTQTLLCTRWIESIRGALLKYEYSETYAVDFLPLPRGFFVRDFTPYELVNNVSVCNLKERINDR